MKLELVGDAPKLDRAREVGKVGLVGVIPKVEPVGDAGKVGEMPNPEFFLPKVGWVGGMGLQ